MIKFALDLLVVSNQNDNVWCGCLGVCILWNGCRHFDVQVNLESKNGSLGFESVESLGTV